MAFVKLDAGILNSTIWVLRPDLELFITALLMATPVQFEEPVATIKIRTLDADPFVIPPGWYGFVEAAGPGIISRAHIEIELGLGALERLASPEPESRSQEFEGRRMVRVNGGYVVLNFMRYRDKDHTAAERQRRLRARRKGESVTGDSNGVTRDVTPVSRDSNVTSRIVTQSEDRGQITDQSIPSAGAEKKERSKNQQKRESNPLIEAVVFCHCGTIEGVPSVTWKFAQSALTQIKAVCPEVTPTEIKRRWVNLRLRFDGELSPAALVKWWTQCDRGPNKGSVPGPDIYTAPPDWRERAAKKWPGTELPATWEELSSALRNDLISAR